MIVVQDDVHIISCCSVVGIERYLTRLGVDFTSLAIPKRLARDSDSLPAHPAIRLNSISGTSPSCLLP